jgi:predicted RNase H-like HicB family nuclease
MTREYVVVFERGENNWSAYSPDVPGCAAAGETREETAQLFTEALALHIEGLREDGLPIPEATTFIDRVRIAV